MDLRQMTDAEIDALYEELDAELARRSHSFTDQNGIQVHDGQMYGIDAQGNLYDLEPLVPFRPSEY